MRRLLIKFGFRGRCQLESDGSQLHEDFPTNIVDFLLASFHSTSEIIQSINSLEPAGIKGF